MAKEFKYMFFDTEMSGREQLVSLGYVIYDQCGEKLAEDYFIIKPHKEIKKISISIHGITTEKARKEGISIKDAIKRFDYAARHSNVIVGYAVKNDLIALSYAYKSLKRQSSILSGRSLIVDAARMGEAYMVDQETGKPGETPGLEHLYSVLFHGETFNAHNALDDAKATARCFWHLMRQSPFCIKAVMPYCQVQTIFG